MIDRSDYTIKPWSISGINDFTFIRYAWHVSLGLYLDKESKLERGCFSRKVTIALERWTLLIRIMTMCLLDKVLAHLPGIVEKIRINWPVHPDRCCILWPPCVIIAKNNG